MRNFKRILALLLCLVTVLTLPAHAVSYEDLNCAENDCDCLEPDENAFPVVSPVGKAVMEQIKQPTRLDTLAGKKLALVGGSFNAAITHEELKKCILEEFPDATVYVLDSDIGKGGTYNPKNQSDQSKNFQKKLQQYGIDAVISGNCGCGICTVKETGNAIAAEYIGIPSVVVGAPTFIAQIKSTGVNRGVSVIRTAEYPGAFSTHTNEELRNNARNIVWPQIKQALTTQISQQEIDQAMQDADTPYDHVVFTGSYQRVQEYYEVNGQSDGLPVLPPTPIKIEKYLRYTPYEATGVIGVIPPAYRQVTAYQVAANCIMSGCPPEFMPFCIAFTKAMSDGNFLKPLVSTHGWTPFAFINGPIARQLGIDCGQGMITEENNKVLGRFIELAMLNLGGYYIKENRMSTFGYLQPWTFSEDDAACVAAGWEPYHVQKGFDLNDNTLTAGSAMMWGNSISPATSDAEDIMNVIAWDITEKQQNGLGTTNPQVHRTLFLTAPVAKDLAALYKSKDVFEDTLIETARRPMWMRAYAYYWANTGSKLSQKNTFEEIYNKLLNDPQEGAALTEAPPWMEGFAADQIMTGRTMLKGHTTILVTGDSSRNKSQVMPGGECAIIKVELPDNWDELMQSLDYAPLSSFYLQSNRTPVQPPKSLPEGLTDGDYRILDATRLKEDMTKEGKLLYDAGAYTLYYWAYGASKYTSVKLDPSGADRDFVEYLQACGVNSSVTVKNGKLTEVELRFSTSAKKPEKNVMNLEAEAFNGVKLTVSANAVRSAAAGGAAVDGGTIILSSKVTSFETDLKKPEMLATSGLVTLQGNKVTVNGNAAPGTMSVIGMQNQDGTYKTYTLKMEANRGYTVTYNANVTRQDADKILLTIGQKEASVFGFVITNDVTPIIRNDRTMLPARFVAENLGAKVLWDAKEPKKVVIAKDKIEIVLYVDSETAYVNGKAVTLDSPAFLENDRTYTPVSFICQNLGADVKWDGTLRQVTILK